MAARVRSLDDPRLEGTITGPSEYEGGVMVRWDNGPEYACSVARIELLKPRRTASPTTEDRDDD